MEATATRTAGGGRSRWRLRSSGVIVAVTLGAAMVAAAVGFLVVPRGGARSQTVRLEEASPVASAVDLTITVDSVDAATGSMQLRLQALPGAHIPPDGAEVFTSVGEIPTLSVSPNRLNEEQAATVLFHSGDIASYPFEDYRATIQFVAEEGTDPTFTSSPTRPRLPVNLEAVTNAAGFNAASQLNVQTDQSVVVSFQVRRTPATRGWVVAMMALYWALAIGAVAVTTTVLRRNKAWETRLLAWLAALTFALVELRTVAPDDPPVGTLLDYYAVFESIAIVALSLIALITYYVVESPQRLGLRPPPSDPLPDTGQKTEQA